MTILNAELQFFAPATVDDTSSNGGRMSSTQLTSGGIENTFEHVQKAERDTGSIKYRKVFCKVSNDDNSTLLAPQIWIDSPTPADDWVTLFEGTQIDTQGGIGTPRLYGCGSLNANVSAAGTSIVADVEDATLTGVFVDGDTIRITDKVNPGDVAGNEEFHVINGTPSVSGTEVTITLTSELANDFTTASNTRIMSVYEPSDVECTTDNWVETSAGTGTFDETTYPVENDNIGTIEQEWTLTFTGATIFTVEGDSVGFIDSGDTGTDYAYDNPDFTGKPYFTLESGGWLGTWASGDTLVFQTHPASAPIWEKRVVPAGAVSSGNKAVLVIAGESS